MTCAKVTTSPRSKADDSEIIFVPLPHSAGTSSAGYVSHLGESMDHTQEVTTGKAA